jgi:hypothetical protein
VTQITDLDRQLADWLGDGPNRAPDQPINAASQFARAHPRRPDPLRLLRADPMADRRRPFGLQPGLVLALLALVIAIVAAGVIGSQVQNPPAVVPPSRAPTSAAPSGSPTPSTSPSAARQFSVDLKTTSGEPASVQIVDGSGRVVSATSGAPLESDSLDGITVRNDKADSLRITWLGSPCDTVHRLTVDATANNIVLQRPRCFGDAIPRFLSVTLKFSGSVVAGDVAASIVEGTGAGGLLPNWTLSGPDTAGNAFHAVVFDASGKLTAAESSSQGGGGATLAPSTGRIEQVGSDTIKVTWARDPCDTNERLDIDADLTTLTLTGSGCVTGPAVFDREMLLTFSGPVRIADVTLKVEVGPVPS